MIDVLIGLTFLIAGAANVIIWGSVLRRARHPQPAAPKHTPKHAATERIHAGGRYTARMPRRDAPPLTEQAIIRQREGRPWDTAPFAAANTDAETRKLYFGGAPVERVLKAERLPEVIA